MEKIILIIVLLLLFFVLCNLYIKEIYNKICNLTNNYIEDFIDYK